MRTTQSKLHDLLSKIPTRRGNSNRWPGLRLKLGYSDVRMLLSHDGAQAEIYGVRGAHARKQFATIDLSSGKLTVLDTGRGYNPITSRHFAIFEAVWADPIAFCDEHGRTHHMCCFCATPLTHKNSTVRGYGPDCAKRYGLPYGD